jgi:hypothetical protein
VTSELRDHPANEDEADRHERHRRVPTAVAIAAAVLVVGALAFLSVSGMGR